MKTTKVAFAGALISALALALSACAGTTTPPPASGTDNSTGSATDNSTANGYMGGTITTHGCTPQNPLFGGTTQEVCGGYILDTVSAQLVYYDSTTAEPKMDIAQSITPNSDSTVFTVKLNQGYKFSDGTEVKAANFVNAWNYEAYEPNGFAQSNFLAPIQGFDAMQCGTASDGSADCTGQPPTATTLSGLAIQDDYDFTITMGAPTSNLVVRLGYPAFQPLPDSFFTSMTADPLVAADLTGQGKIPVTAGPYMVQSNTSTDITLVKNPYYTGPNPGHVDKIDYRIYNDLSAAWNDIVANNLDFIDSIPSDQLVNDQWISTIGKDRTSSIPGPTIQAIDFSPTDPQLKDVKLRQAISMAIDRTTITQQIFNSTRVPMTGWVPPFIDGYTPNQCGDTCNYDPTQAKALYAQTAGYTGTLQLSVNGDGGHGPWATAVCNSINQVLGIDCQVNTTPDFATLLNEAQSGQLQGMFRSGWAMDYPSIEDYLAPIYQTGADSNYTNYSNPQFDSLLKQAAAAPTVDAANALYQQAERLLAQDLPSIPMWYYNLTTAWSNRVTNVITTPFGYADLSAIQVLPGK
jgi:oligopeptide transport system substrate-binding protein